MVPLIGLLAGLPAVIRRRFLFKSLGSTLLASSDGAPAVPPLRLKKTPGPRTPQNGEFMHKGLTLLVFPTISFGAGFAPLA